MGGWNETIQDYFAQERNETVGNKSRAKVETIVRPAVALYLGRAPDAKVRKKEKIVFTHPESDARAIADEMAVAFNIHIPVAELEKVTNYGEFLALVQECNEKAKAARKSAKKSLNTTAKAMTAKTMNATPAQIKPSLTEVADAFHQMRSDVTKALVRMTSGGKHPSRNEVQAGIDAAHNTLRTKLEAWGMADKIDWDKQE